MSADNPGAIGKWFETVVQSWRSLRPQKKFLNLTVEEAEKELKPCHDARGEIGDLDQKLIKARNRRDKLDAEGLKFVTHLVNAIKSDETEGEESALPEAIGYVIPSKRKSGLHCNVPQSPSDSSTKAA
jgi:hypothetical protein